MKKFWGILALLFMLSICAATAEELILPSGLTEIEAEAFKGNTQMCGLIDVPSGVKRIGCDAFSATSLYALDLPEGVETIESQAFSGAAYVRVRGAETELGSLSGIRYLIAPKGSDATVPADTVLIASEQLYEHAGFLYLKEDGTLTLLCAKDAEKLGESVSIPAEAGGMPVTALMKDAFMGFENVKTILLPAALREQVTQDMLTDCPSASLYYDDETGLVVRAVTADVAPGESGSSITWNVDTLAENGVSSYAYTLTRDGVTLMEKSSALSTFTYETNTPGAYRLSVAVTDRMGAVARGASAVLYIAEQTLDMTVPSTLAAGEDLVISVSAVEGATRYCIIVTNVETKETVLFNTMTRADSRTVYGYALEAGAYRVAGYVFGDDFQYSIPTVRYVTVTGGKAPGPQLPEYEPVSLQDGGYVEMMLSETEPFAVRYWCRYRDGSTTDRWENWAEPGERIAIWPEGDWDMYGGDSCIFLQAAIRQNGKWTDWGEIREVPVLAEPTLDKPVVHLPQTAQAGKDLTFSLEAVENAERYWVGLYKGTEPHGEVLYSESFRVAGEVIIPGYELGAGSYCVVIQTEAEGYAYREDSYPLTVTGTRPAAPTVTTDRTEIYATDDRVTLTILAPGAEGALIYEELYRGNGTRGSSRSTISLDENGNGTGRVTSWGSDTTGWTDRIRVAAIIDGVWSEFAVLELPILARPPMDVPVVTMPATLIAGQDFTFCIAPVENAQKYSASIRRSYGSSFYEWNSSELKADQDATLPGYKLSQGNYILTVTASSNEFGSSEISMPLTVTGTKPAAPAITASLDECHIKETIAFDIATAGADKVCIDYDRVMSWTNTSTTERTVVGDTTQWKYTFSESELGAAFTFRFSVRKDGIWSAWKTFERTVLDLPALEAPVIHAKAVYQAGEDMLLSFDPVEHAQEYSHALWNENGSGNSGSKQAQENTYLYNGYEYEPGVYRFEVTAKSSAYRNAVSKMAIEVVGVKPAAPEVSAGQTRAARYEDFTFTMDTTGAEAARYRYKKNTSDYWNSSGHINVLEDSTKWTTYNSSSGTYEYSFCVLRDGRWTQWSEPIGIFIEDSSLPAPVLSLPQTLDAGQDLTVSVAPIEGMTSCYIYLYNSYGTRLGYKSLSGASGGSVTFDGYLLSPGTYRIEADASSATASSETTVGVTVRSGDRPTAPGVQAETETGRVNIRYGFAVATEGAQLAAVRYYRDGATGSVTYRTFDVTDNETLWQDVKYESDQTWRYAFAVKKDGVWSPWSASHAVYITNREMLPEVTLNVPKSIEAGEDLVVSFEGVQNADSYTLYLYRPDGSSFGGYTVYPGVERRFAGYDLTEGMYRVEVRATGAQYEESRAEAAITVTGSRSAAPTVTVSTQEVYTEENFTFLIDSANAQQVAYKYVSASGSSSSGRLNVLSALTSWETSVWNASVYTFSFSVQRDDRWSAWSTPIQVTGKLREPLPQPSFTAPQTIEQGRDLTVSVGAVENATYYYVYLYNKYGENIAGRHLTAPGDADFAGYLLPVGQLRIEVEAHNNVGGYSQAVGALTVMQAQRPAAPAAVPESTTVSSGSYAVFTLDTAGAQKVAVRIYRVGSPNNVWYETITPSADGTTTYSDYLSYSDCTYAYSFAVMIDGVWSPWSEFAEIDIR